MSRLQSIIFNKDYFTKKEVKDYISNHGHTINYGIDVKKHTYRVRQIDPHIFSRFRVIKPREGIELVIGFY